jgi:hypothetical protein
VQDGVWVLQDARRNKLCGICWAKLSTKKGDPRIVEGRKVCLPCRMDAEDAHTGRATIVTVAEAVARPAPAAAAAPVVPAEWEAYRWCIFNADDDLLEWSLIMYDVIQRGGLSQWNKMRRGFLQHETTPNHPGMPEGTNQLMVGLRSTIETIGRRLLRDLGVDSSDLELRVMDILSFPPNHAQPQSIHMDLIKHEEALLVYQLVVYLSPEGTISTAFTQRHPDELLDCWGAGMPPHATLQLLKRSCFQTHRVPFAAASLFRADVVHFGDANPDDWTRYAAFCCFQPRSLTISCGVQRYPWGVRTGLIQKK